MDQIDSARFGDDTVCAGAGSALFDPQSLDYLADIPATRRRELVDRLFSTFEQSSTKLVEQLEHACRLNDRDLARTAAHTLKSSAGQVGAATLSRLSARIEKLAATDHALNEVVSVSRGVLPEDRGSHEALGPSMNSQTEIIKDQVVLIEDDPVIEVMVVEALEREGYDVSAFSSGEDALARMGEIDAALILLDVMLPGINGFETCARLRQSSGTLYTPIILMTGLDDVESINTGFGAGATDFITKPLNIPLLVQRIRFVMRTSSAAQALRKSEQRLAKAQQLARVSYWEYDLETRTAELSPELQQIIKSPYRLVPVDTLASSFQHLRLGELIKAGRQAIQAGEPMMFEQTIRVGRNQEERTILHHAELVRTDGGRRLLGTSQDITERKRIERKLESLANFDALTGLPNRRYLRRYLAEVLAGIEIDGRGDLAMLALDLDLFKRVNDSVGYAVGDQLLVAVAERLNDVVRNHNRGRIGYEREADLVARVSGDEFVIVLRDVAGRKGAELAASRVLSAFERPFRIDGDKDLFISSSMGVLISPEDGTDVDSLLQSLDTALRTAKDQGRNNWQFYRSVAGQDLSYPVALSSELRRALKLGQLRLAYQPKFNGDQTLIGVEALARWTHPKLGPISPETFIPIAEESGQVVELGNWVIDSTCRQIREVAGPGPGLSTRGHQRCSTSVYGGRAACSDQAIVGPPRGPGRSHRN